MSAQISPNLNLNYKWSLGEDNWNVGMDENLFKLDSLIQLSVISKDLNSPPPIANLGDRYIVGPLPEYEWDSKQNNIVIYYDSVWNFQTPKPGFIAYIQDINKIYIYNINNTWTEIQTGGNTLDLTATNIEFESTTNILSTNVQDAIEEVRDSIPTISGVTASTVDIDPILNLTATNVQEALEALNNKSPQDLAATNISFTPTTNILSTNTQEAIEEVNNKILSSQVIYPIWKINENETIEVLERQEYGINSGILYLQGVLILNSDSILVINN